MKYEEFLEQLKTKASRLTGEDSFRARVAELAKNFSGESLDELNAEIQTVVESHNRAPRHEFAGLSSDEMHFLFYYPLEKNSPIQFRPLIGHDVLNKIGFFRLVEEFLKIVKRDGSIKLTEKLGALPRKTLVELYDHHFVRQWPIDEGFIKLRYEDDSSVMRTLHAIVRISGLVRKLHGKLVLTKMGEKMLAPAARSELFRIVFHAFTRKFNWAYNDFYPHFSLCRQAFGFSLYLVARFGDNETHKDFYTEKFLTAFPMALQQFQGDSYSTPESNFRSCYRIRTFDRFLEWFNFVDVRSNEETLSGSQMLVKKSELFDAVFYVG
ncbi:MAG: hypothetical protein ACK4S4_06810 [Pyrinomonadaceae bacterium]